MSTARAIVNTTLTAGLSTSSKVLLFRGTRGNHKKDVETKAKTLRENADDSEKRFYTILLGVLNSPDLSFKSFRELDPTGIQELFEDRREHKIKMVRKILTEAIAAKAKDCTLDQKYGWKSFPALLANSSNVLEPLFATASAINGLTRLSEPPVDGMAIHLGINVDGTYQTYGACALVTLFFSDFGLQLLNPSPTKQIKEWEAYQIKRVNTFLESIPMSRTISAADEDKLKKALKSNRALKKLPVRSKSQPSWASWIRRNLVRAGLTGVAISLASDAFESTRHTDDDDGTQSSYKSYAYPMVYGALAGVALISGSSWWGPSVGGAAVGAAAIPAVHPDFRAYRARVRDLARETITIPPDENAQMRTQILSESECENILSGTTANKNEQFRNVMKCGTATMNGPDLTAAALSNIRNAVIQRNSHAIFAPLFQYPLFETALRKFPGIAEQLPERLDMIQSIARLVETNSAIAPPATLLPKINSILENSSGDVSSQPDVSEVLRDATTWPTYVETAKTFFKRVHSSGTEPAEVEVVVTLNDEHAEVRDNKLVFKEVKIELSPSGDRGPAKTAVLSNEPIALGISYQNALEKSSMGDAEKLDLFVTGPTPLFKDTAKSLQRIIPDLSDPGSCLERVAKAGRPATFEPKNVPLDFVVDYDFIKSVADKAEGLPDVSSDSVELNMGPIVIRADSHDLQLDSTFIGSVTEAPSFDDAGALAPVVVQQIDTNDLHTDLFSPPADTASEYYSGIAGTLQTVTQDSLQEFDDIQHALDAITADDIADLNEASFNQARGFLEDVFRHLSDLHRRTTSEQSPAKRHATETARLCLKYQTKLDAGDDVTRISVKCLKAWRDRTLYQATTADVPG